MSIKYKIGDILDLSVEKIIPNGLGLCFAKNLTVFVPLSVKGDKLRVEIKKLQGKIAFAKIIEILESSDQRIEPKCTYFGTCGGCDFQQMSYESQLEAKIDIIQDCLKRIGKIDFKKEIPIIPSPKQFGYRLRTQLHADTRSEKLGFFKRQSHKVVDAKSCPVLTPALEKNLNELRENIAWESFFEEIVNIETASGENGVSVYSDELIEPTNEIFYELDDDRYFFNAKSFFQGNTFLIKSLVETAIENAEGKTAFDLYCGVGLFSLSLAEKFEEVLAVEANKTAIEFAKKNAEYARIENVDFYDERVKKFLTETAENIESADFILLDPPRSGVKKGTLEKITEFNTRHISYVSCNPSTLARDLQILTNKNYEIETITALDLFPQTHHVETIVHLKK